MNPVPLSRLSDAELDERTLRFGDRAMAADQRHDRTNDPADRLEARQCWEAVFALTREMLRRSRMAKSASNDSGQGPA